MQRSATKAWMAGAFGVALALALAILASRGIGERGIRLALRVTARWSFLLFWPAYAGGAMASLFGPRFQALARRGREFALAYASAQLVHAGLVVWLYRIAVRSPVSDAFLVFFGAGLFWTYFLALLSMRRFSGILSPAMRRLAFTIGVQYIALAFLVDFARNPFRGGAASVAEYLPFLVLAVAGPVLRLVALAMRRNDERVYR